jgi:hypothetical protein
MQGTGVCYYTSWLSKSEIYRAGHQGGMIETPMEKLKVQSIGRIPFLGKP